MFSCVDIYEYGYGRQRDSNFSGLSPRYIDGIRQIPKFPPPLPPYSFDDPDLSNFDCSVVDSQYVNDFGDNFVYPTSQMDEEKVSPFRFSAEPADSGCYSGSDSCRSAVHQNNNTLQKLPSKQTDNVSSSSSPQRRSSFDCKQLDQQTMVAYAPETICCKSAPSLQKSADGFSYLMSDCEKQTQTDDLELLTTTAPITSLPDLNYEIPKNSAAAAVVFGRNGRANTFLLNDCSTTTTTNHSKLPLRVRSCNK